MGLDTSIYNVHLPQGTYSAGVPVPLNVVFGPSVVRDGNGTAVLKEIFTASIFSGSSSSYVTRAPEIVTVKNSNWVDSVSNIIVPIQSANLGTILDPDSSAVQRCGDIQLAVNSSFTVTWTPKANITIGEGEVLDVFVNIVIDYAAVSSVDNPSSQMGSPVTILQDLNVTPTLVGSDLTWNTINVDFLKAGYRYILTEVSAIPYSNLVDNSLGFIAISGAAGMGGLVQVIPFVVRSAGSGMLRYHLKSSNIFVKGPINLAVATVDNANAPTVQGTTLEFDFIRR